MILENPKSRQKYKRPQYTMESLELSDKAKKYWKQYLRNEAFDIAELLAFYGSKSHWDGDLEDLMKRAVSWEKKRKAVGL